MAWDEPDLLHNVKRVSPWLVDLVSNVPTIHLSLFSPPRKKLRIPQPPDFSPDGQFPFPYFSGNPFGPSSPICCLSDNVPAGIQGARHARFGIPLSDLHLTNKLQLGLFPSSFQHLDPRSKISDGIIQGSTNSNNENVSCLLTMGHSSHKLDSNDEKVRAPLFILFGQPILTEQQISRGCSSDTVSKVSVGNSSSDGSSDGFLRNQGFRSTEAELDTGHCKVFLESEDVGRTLDLSVLGSYEDLYKRLCNMFGIERFENLTHVLYKDVAGAIKRTGDEPFRYFYHPCALS